MPTTHINSLESLQKYADNQSKAENQAQNITTETISNPNIWTSIMAQISEENQTFLSSYQPMIDQDTFVFKVANEIQKSMIEENFNLLNDIYYQIEKKYAKWKCIIDEQLIINQSQNKELTKYEKFEILAQKNPILLTLKSQFNLDFY